MPRLSIDQLAALEGEDANEVFAWVDWKAEEREVVEAFAEQLVDGDELAYREHDGRTTPIYNGVQYPVPLTGTGSDRYVMVFSLAEILKERYAVFRHADCLGDTHGFLLLTHEEAADLARRFPKWQRKHLETMSMGVDGFSGLDLPWYGHEDHAPHFTRKRAALDAGIERDRARSRRFHEAMAADYDGSRETGESLLLILSRQQAAAGAYGVAALLCLLGAANAVGGSAMATRTLWIAAALFASAAVYHGVLFWHVRGGWRPATWHRVLPGAVLIGLLFLAPGLLRGG